MLLTADELLRQRKRRNGPTAEVVARTLRSRSRMRGAASDVLRVAQAVLRGSSKRRCLSLSGRVYPVRIWASVAQAVVDASAAEVAEPHAASAEVVVD